MHTCALTVDGAVKCWGQNDRGQLGNGSKTYDPISTPVDVMSLATGVEVVSAGASHTCAVTSAGALKCWGGNNYGQLGNGSKKDSLVPVDVMGLSSGAVGVSASYSHSCALTAAGAVKCWGGNEDRKLGDGSKKDSLVPVDVVGLSSGIVGIAAGGHHTCALSVAGAVKCWGDNSTGQLGDGSTTNSAVPVDVLLPASNIVSVAAGDWHTCALTAGGAVKCWGSSYDGELGNDSKINSSVPVDVVGLSTGFVGIAPGSTHTCALTASMAVKCWGGNSLGQLGNDSTVQSLVPVSAVGL
jgi:alpha-tubulin suppressor-like RCC1 family protein